MSLNQICGIYAIVNKENGKVYIGSSLDVHRRFATHFMRLNNKTHQSPHLQAAWEFYGHEGFEFRIIEECSSEVLLQREQYYLDLYQAYEREKGYNTCTIAGNTTGYRHSLEAKMSMSGKKIRQKVVRKNLKVYTGEDNKWYGKEHSAETKERIREYQKKNCRMNNPNRKLTWEKVKKIRELYAQGKYSMQELANMMQIKSASTINTIVKNRTWNYPEEQVPEKSYKCKICGESFYFGEDFFKHLREKHEITDRMYTIKYLCERESDYLCRECGKPAIYCYLKFKSYCKEHRPQDSTDSSPSTN